MVETDSKILEILVVEVKKKCTTQNTSQQKRTERH